jgi:hypothetical protein
MPRKQYLKHFLENAPIVELSALKQTDDFPDSNRLRHT